MNLIEKIFNEMQNDEADMTKESEILLRFYNAGHPEYKAGMDMLCICLCGYSVETLTKQLNKGGK